MVDNRIPIGKGLGSSPRRQRPGQWRQLAGDGGRQIDPERLFNLVAEIEEHPDNAAAAVYGGLVLVSSRWKGETAHLASEL